MKSKPRNLVNREYLIRKLKKKAGVPRRLSVEILDQLFSEIKQALARGEEVEFPFGKLKVVRHKHRTQTGHFLNRKMTTYKQPFTVELEMDKKGERLLKPIILPLKPGSPPGTKPIVIYPSLAFRNVVLPPKPTPKKRQVASSQPIDGK